VRTLVAMLLLSLLAAAPAGGAELRLRWGACGANGATTRGFACDRNVGADTLVASVVSAGDIITTPGIDVMLAIFTPVNQGPFPSWWMMTGPADCRWTTLTTEPMVQADGGCQPFFESTQSFSPSIVPTPWDFDHAGVWTLRMPVHIPGSAREFVLCPAGTEYGLARFIVGHNLTTGPGACSGCGQPMSITFSGLWFLNEAGTRYGSFPIGPSAASTVTWNPSPTPAHPTTWGAIKSLYR
jgi:hypothetical protein